MWARLARLVLSSACAISAPARSRIRTTPRPSRPPRASRAAPPRSRRGAEEAPGPRPPVEPGCGSRAADRQVLRRPRPEGLAGGVPARARGGRRTSRARSRPARSTCAAPRAASGTTRPREGKRPTPKCSSCAHSCAGTGSRSRLRASGCATSTSRRRSPECPRTGASRPELRALSHAPAARAQIRRARRFAARTRLRSARVTALTERRERREFRGRLAGAWTAARRMHRPPRAKRATDGPAGAHAGLRGRLRDRLAS